MNVIFKKYYLLVLLSFMIIALSSCTKGDEPVPVIEQEESSLDNDGSTSDKAADKGGDKTGDEIVGGDDDEDDDGGIVDLGDAGGKGDRINDLGYGIFHGVDHGVGNSVGVSKNGN